MLQSAEYSTLLQLSGTNFVSVEAYFQVGFLSSMIRMHILYQDTFF